VISAGLDRINPETGLSLQAEEKIEIIEDWQRSLEQGALAMERRRDHWEMLQDMAGGHSSTESSEAAEHLRMFARKGVPHELRPIVWRRLVDIHNIRVEGQFLEHCLEAEIQTQQLRQLIQDCDSPKLEARMQAIEDIDKDVERTFPEHEDYKRLQSGEVGPGVTRLRRVLTAYAMRNPKVGYCQGMNFAAGALFLVLDSEEEVYWAMAMLVERLFPRYFEHMVLGSMIDQCVFAEFLAALMPDVTVQLETLGVELPVICMHWFNSLFVETVPFEAMLRIWDALLADGREALIRIALALILHHKDLIMNATSFEEVIVGLRCGLLRQFDGEGLVGSAYRDVGEFTSAELESSAAVYEQRMADSLATDGSVSRSRPWSRAMSEGRLDQGKLEEAETEKPEYYKWIREATQPHLKAATERFSKADEYYQVSSNVTHAVSAGASALKTKTQDIRKGAAELDEQYKVSETVSAGWSSFKKYWSTRGEAEAGRTAPPHSKPMPRSSKPVSRSRSSSRTLDEEIPEEDGWIASSTSSPAAGTSRWLW